MWQKYQEIQNKYESIQEQLMDPAVMADQDKLIKLSRESSRLEPAYKLFKNFKTVCLQIEEAKEILDTETDADMVEMAKMQLSDAQKELEPLEEQLKVAILPRDPMDDNNIFLEIRQAAGGDEAGLFALELLRSYTLYAQDKGWKVETVEQQMSDVGGVKFAMLKISGDSVYSILKFESGVHRVQRIPATESQGRVHTSTITVAIMPEVTAVDLKVNPKDIEMDTFAASSAGGQNANKNQTGVRLRHIPSGLIVTIADSKSQIHNKEKAHEVLRSRLYQIEYEKKVQESRDIRGAQIGSGDRSEKIRTYNFPQDRVTDHRIKESWSNLPGIMQGQLQPMFDALILDNQTQLLAAQTASSEE